MTINSLEELVIIAFLALGTFFMFVGALGVIRLPDLYMRMSASTKSSTLGVGFILLAAALYFGDDLGVAARAIATIAFLVLTAPVAAHMIGRAGYYSGSKLWSDSLIDELKGRYDHDKNVLLSAPPQDSTRDTTPTE